MTRFFVGITGASGHAYADALLRALLAAGETAAPERGDEPPPQPRIPGHHAADAKESHRARVAGGPLSRYGLRAPDRTNTGMVSSVVVISAVVPPRYRLPVK